MNNHTSFVLLAVLTVVGTLTMSSTYAEMFVGDADAGREAANQILLSEIPISVVTDKTTYDHNDKIIVHGKVANISTFPVTLTVTSPSNSIVTIAQIEVDSDGNYETTLSTEGGLWKHDGTYMIKVNYGTNQKSNKAFVELTDEYSDSADNCSSSEIYLKGDYCVPYSISGGIVTGASINNNDNSIIVRINANEDGTITLTPDESILRGIFMVLVDGQEWNDVEINDNDIIVMFPAGTEKIEVVGTFVVPEFGTIAVMILAVAIISIIAVSAKSRLSIMPKY